MTYPLTFIRSPVTGNRVLARQCPTQRSAWLWLTFGTEAHAVIEPLVMLDSQAPIKGRGYHVDDLPTLMSLGASSGYLAVLVMALYVNNPDINTIYANPMLLWLIPPLMLYWVSRIWMKTHRGEMHDDPVVFATQDRISQVVGLLAAGVLLLTATSY